MRKLIFLAFMLVISCGSTYANNEMPNHHSKNYTGDRLSLNFSNIKLGSLLQLVADYKEPCIIINDAIDTDQPVYIRIQNTPWDHVLDEIGYEHGFIATYKDSIIYLEPSKDTSLKTGLVTNKKNMSFSDDWPGDSKTWKKIVITYGDGTKYVGEAIGHIPNGLGVLLDADGTIILEGKWVDGKLNGFGRAYPANNYPSSQEYYYAGEFKNNEYSGYGILNHPYIGTGFRFEGMFKEGEPDGYGLYYDYASKQETYAEVKHDPVVTYENKIDTCRKHESMEQTLKN